MNPEFIPFTLPGCQRGMTGHPDTPPSETYASPVMRDHPQHTNKSFCLLTPNLDLSILIDTYKTT